MKTTNLLFAACVTSLFALAPSAPAAPMGDSNDASEHLVAARDLSALGLGAYVEFRERNIRIDGRTQSLETDRLMAYVDWRILRWLAPYVAAGEAEHQVGSDNGDGHVEWAVGARVNLLDHDIMDPFVYEDRIRVNANVHYGWAETEGTFTEEDWSELSGSLTVSIVNDVDGNKLFLPNAIGLFVGPMYSSIDGDDIEEVEDFGYTAGIEIYYSEKVTIDVAVEDLDDTSIVGGLHVRF